QSEEHRCHRDFSFQGFLFSGNGCAKLVEKVATSLNISMPCSRTSILDLCSKFDPGEALRPRGRQGKRAFSTSLYLASRPFSGGSCTLRRSRDTSSGWGNFRGR